MKYRVGDRVKIKENLIIGNMYGGLCLYGSATRHIGEETMVTKVERDRYRLAVDNSSRIWTNEMLEPVEEMSAEEAVRLYAKVCKDSNCYACPVYKKSGECGCEEFAINHPEEVIESLKQWKADHEKKEVEFACIVRVIEDADSGRRCVYEEDVTEVKDETFKMSIKRILEEYCKEHEGKFFTAYEEICRVKE